MDTVFQALRPFIRAVVRHAGAVVAVALLCSAAGLYFAWQLRIDTDLSKLVPSDYPSVQALERLRATVGGESEVAVAIHSPSFEANKAFAEALIPRAMTLQGAHYREPYFTRVEYRRETDFLKDNALYFATSEELALLEEYLQTQIEDARLAANPFFFDLEEEDAEADVPDPTAAYLTNAYESIVGREYQLSPDSTTLVVRFFPAGSRTNLGYIEDTYRDLEALAAAVGPASFHPEMEVTFAGRLLRQLIEVRTIQEDVLSSFGVGVAAVLLVVVLYFLYKAYRARSNGRFSARLLFSQLARAPVLAAVVGLPLLMSLTWSFGVAQLIFGSLNLMTSTLGLVLFGLGIDYGIHFYARYTEERARGRSVVDAAETTFTSTGQAVAVGAFSTAAALYVLAAADFRGFSEFGVIAGNGVLFALVAMLVVLPALIALFERFRLLNFAAGAAAPAAAPGAAAYARRLPGARGIVVASLAVVAAAVFFLPRVGFEYDFGALEPEFEAYNAPSRKVRVAYRDDGRHNPAYILADTPGEVPGIVAALRQKAAADTLSPTIRMVESLQDRFPMAPEAQERKLARIAAMRTLLEDPFLQADPSEELARLARAAQTRTPITLDEVPESLRKQFTSKTGEIGNFVVVYPSVGLSDGRQSIAFAEDVGRVETADGRVYHAASTSLVAADMLRLMQREAPWMVAGTFLIVALLMWLNFGSLRWAVVALLPLVVGVLWMLLLMEFLGLKLNFYNLVVLPAVLGIGNDAGAHIAHRYREEGRGSLRFLLRSTGEHVTMSALTTMIGFGGLLLSFHPGLRSIGELAVAGIGTTLLASILFLPALLQWLEDRDRTPHDEPVLARVQDVRQAAGASRRSAVSTRT